MPEIDSAFRRIKSWFVPGEAPRNAQSESDLLRTWIREIDACAREQGGAIAARTRAAGLMPLYQAMNAATVTDRNSMPFTVRHGCWSRSKIWMP